jgi:hypothetical protein
MEELSQRAKVLAGAAVALAGLLMLPAGASARRHEPRSYHGTIVLNQTAPVPGTFHSSGNSSVSYRFHARYKVSGKRKRAPRGRKGSEYALIGRGRQVLAYRANLSDTGNPNNTRASVEDWHGSGVWGKHDGAIGFLNVAGKRFAFGMGVGLFGRGTLPLSVSSQETDFFTDDTQTCHSTSGQSGSTIMESDDCSGSRTLTIPVSTSITPDALLQDNTPQTYVCPGTKKVQRAYNGFCGSAKGSGRIHPRAYKTTISRPLDYPFSPWEDEAAAGDAQANAGFSFKGAGGWGDLIIRTTFTIDLKPGK